MKHGSGTNVWYLLVLIALAIVFIFAGIKFLGSGDRIHEQNQPTTNTTATGGTTSSASQSLPLDQQYAAKGAESLDKGDYQSAIDYFTKAIAADPSVTNYYSLKAQAEVLAGKSADAKTTLEAGLKIDPENELLNSKLDVLDNASNLAPANQDNPRL
jgi:tetratricopeptide (TPR) repeat protein